MIHNFEVDSTKDFELLRKINKQNMEKELNQHEDFLKLVFTKNKKIYISGAISEVPHKNIDAFIKASNYITALDCVPVDPHIICEFIKDGSTWESYMKVCLKHIPGCDAMVVIDGWETSRGVPVEVFNAQQMKIPVFHFPSLEIFSYHFNLQKEKINY